MCVCMYMCLGNSESELMAQYEFDIKKREKQLEELQKQRKELKEVETMLDNLQVERERERERGGGGREGGWRENG